jgi:TfoX/Sxy family transcriptional regulator of competence genes
MAYDEKLAAKIRSVLEETAGWTERKMFGGLAFLRHGSMCCGIVGQQLMVRVGPEAYEETLDMPHVHPMDFTGRPMRGFIYVDPAGTKTVAAIRNWIARSAAAPKPYRAKPARKLR